MPVPDKEYFSFAKELCKKNGTMLIMDEVQAGLGRTGKLWGIENFNVSPDIMVIGKGLSGGIYPMSATCFTKELQAFFHANPFIHISTFGGAEVGCPVAMKVLEISSAPEFLKNVLNISDRIAKGFGELKQRHPGILTGLRRLGLMMGIEMSNDICGPVMTKTCYDNGILSIYANNDKRISQLLPPLIADEALADEILDRLDSSLADAEKILGL
jgi:acetylornithine/succinyldiaminopimelate/putrescine aminotransferase